MDLREYLEEKTKEAESRQEIVDQDPNRLALHLMPPVGWINDPNGLCQFHGVYHVFYQYSPIDPNGSFKAWGHYTSEDQIHWKQLPTAFYPDEEFDKDGVYSGSAFIENDRMYLFYTGNVKQEGDHDADLTYSGREANTVLVTSEDGIHFSEKQLIMTNADYPAEYTCHIRDPKVWKMGDTYYMIQGGRKMTDPTGGISANSKETDYGTVLLFGSADLVHWSFLKDVTTDERFGYMWECPDYFVIDGQPVLSVSPQGLEHEMYRYQNVYQSGYFLLEDEIISPQDKHNTVVPDPEKFHEWDYGFDFYAPQTFCDESGRRIIIGWAGIGDADYDNAPTVAAGWQHSLTLPREIIWQDGRLLQKPLAELENLRKDQISFEGEYNAEQTVFEIEAEQIYADCMVKISSGQESFCVNYEMGILDFSITEKAGCGRKSRKIQLDELKNMRLIVDNSMVEIYINDGEYVITSKFYFPDRSRKIEVKGVRDAKLWYLDGLEVTR